MTRPIDFYWIVLVLNHPDCDPAEITNVVALKPFAAMRSGQKVGSITRKTSVWMHRFREGLTNDNFGEALEDFVSLLDKHKGFLDRFISQGGEIKFEFNQVVGTSEGITLHLTLEPFFLKTCGDYNVRLQIQTWVSDQTPSDQSLAEDSVLEGSH